MHIVIDTRPKPQEPKKLDDADLIIEIDLYDDGYHTNYIVRGVGNAYTNYEFYAMRGVDRANMVEQHVNVIRAVQPKTAVVRTGKHSTGHVRDIPLIPGVLKLIIDGTLGAKELTLRG